MNSFRRLFGVMLALLGALLLALPAQAQQSADGYFNWAHVGASAVKRFQGGDPKYQNWARSQVLSALSFNASESSAILDKFNTRDCIAGTIKAGDEFEAGSFLSRNGQVKVTGKVRLTDTSEESFEVCRVYIKAGETTTGGYTFTRDIAVTLVYKCGNVVLEKSPPPPPAPVVVPSPVLPVLMAPPSPLPPVVATKEGDKFCDNLRVNAVVGAELELNEARAWSLYGAWGVYCMKKLKDGQIGFGVGGQYATYGSGPGNGKFRGSFYDVGPSMLRVWNKGQDLEIKVMGGQYSSDYREGDYRSQERTAMGSIAIHFNDYRGRVNGTGRPERQYSLIAGLPIGSSSGEWWQEKQISDGSHLQAYLNFGVRQYLQKEDPKRNWNTYVQVGGLAEFRSGADYFSCSFRFGVTNKHRTIGVHAGINACNGSIVPAVGVWYDIGNSLKLRRAARRAAAVANDNGEGRAATTTFTGRKLASTRE